MKSFSKNFTILCRVMLIVAALGSVSCVTSYDYAGNPIQTVDPAAAAAGVMAVGLLGYAIAGAHGHCNYPVYYNGHHCY